MIAATLADPSLDGWDGFGLAIQAYQKRASAVIDHVDELARAHRPPADGAAGQGRLLGHRDQARAGARARRLSGVHPQGDDRSELRRLRRKTAGAAAAHLPAIRDPQRADRRNRAGAAPADAAASSSSACTAWARRSTSSSRRIIPISPTAPTRRSAAIATCSPIWCGGCWRTAPTPPSWRRRPIIACRSRRC